MVRKKSQSKRQTLHKKYKILKKVREHHRKLRREAKKNPHKRKVLKKDPGIPNLYPFKEKFIEKMERMQEKEERNKERQKQERAERREKKRQENLLDMVKSARERERKFEKLQNQTPAKELTTTPDGSKKAFYREFKKVVEAADVVLEVLDARDPLGCRCRDVEEMILRKDPNKKIILILNKIDLVPKENVEKWLKYLRNEYPTLAFKCSTQKQRKNIGQSSLPTSSASADAALQTSECLGAENLIQLLKNYSRSLNLKTSITVGTIGYPNVGKSSLINSLKRSRAVGVGATPGFTKSMQEIHLDKNVKLLDCPGIVFSSDTSEADLVLRNCIKVDHLADPVAPVELILRRCRRDKLMQLYKIAAYEDCREFLSHIAHKRGKLGKGGVPDYEAAARTVLQDWIGGKIAFYTEPPKERAGVHVSASIVSGWGQALDLDLNQIIQNEETMVLSSLKDNNENLQQQQRWMSLGTSSVFSNSVDSRLVKHLAAREGEEEDDDDDDDDANKENENDDDEDDDDDEEDGGEVDAVYRTMDVGTSGVGGSTSGGGVHKILGDEEDVLNPQVNRKLRKQLRKQKQKMKGKQKLVGSDEEEEEVEEEDDDNFDFAKDFIAQNDFFSPADYLVGKKQESEEEEEEEEEEGEGEGNVNDDEDGEGENAGDLQNMERGDE